MANDFQWDVVVRLATIGAKQSKGEIEGLKTAVDGLARTGNVSDKALSTFEKSIGQVGTSAKSTTGDMQNMEASAISLRYANYDLATSMFALSAAVVASGVGVVSAFASQESAFTNVERTADGALGNIRQSLQDLSTQIPLSFNELAEIATLGNQLGIGADQLEDFTTTVAQFSAVTGISAEQSALAFGKLGNLLGVSARDYDRLASSIALVGRTTAATEAQIVSVASEIAPAAAAAGFTADQVIGLSGALASLKVPPERSRSTILQFFETLNTAAAEGGDKLENFARVVGVTAGELNSMISNGQGKDILTRFIGNVSSSDTIEITQALEALGLAGLRTNPTIRALAGNTQLLNQSLQDGRTGYVENIELQRQMAFILDDLSTKWSTFLNAAMNAAAAIGTAVGPTFGIFLDVLKNVLIGLAEFAQTDFGQGLFRLISVIGAAVAAYGVLRGGIALATASLQAFSLISGALGGAGILAGLRGLATAFTTVTATAGTAAAVTGHVIPGAFGASTVASSRLASALRIAGGAFLVLGRATIILGLLQAATSLVFDFAGSMQFVAGVAEGFVREVGFAFAKFLNFVADVADSLSGLSPELSRFAASARLASVGINLSAAAGTLTKDFSNWANSLKSASDGMDELGESADIPYNDYAGGVSDLAGATDGLGDSAKNAAREVRTLVDYSNDLQSVFSRSFDIRFAGGSTLDAISSTFISIQEATEASARSIQKLKAEIQGLQSDLNIQRIFLGVAIEYGDTARAEAIQANIAKIQADLADKTSELSEEQTKNSKTLTGNSKAAIANRTQIEELVKQYQAHVTALAASGLSQADLSRKTAELRNQFIQQAVQLGYSRTEVEKYAVAFDDIRIAIEGVPRNITVTANVNPALQALNELEAKARSVGGALGGIGGSAGAGAKEAADKLNYRVRYSIAAMQASIAALQAAFAGNPFEAFGYRATAAAYQAEMGHWRSLGGFSEGGFTGQGGKYQAAGIVHRGEYVVPKKDVNQRTGLPYADAMGRLQRGASGPGYASGGYVRGGGGFSGAMQMGSLGPMAQQQFNQMFADNLRVYLDGQRVADNSAQQYANQTANGAY